MNIRKSRQQEIITLITGEPISTQDELIKKLREKGFDVTQATVSRDIKDLKLIKKIGTSGKSVYSVNTSDEDNLSSKYKTIISGAIVHADYAMNTCVVKTHVGMANAACASIDAMHWEGTLGTIAGDDTIFVLCRSEQDARIFCEKLKSMITE